MTARVRQALVFIAALLAGLMLSCPDDEAVTAAGSPGGNARPAPASQPQTVARQTMPASAPASAPAEAPRRVHVFVSGRVQGVGYRAFTQAEARRLGLSGFVTNLVDGRVEAVIEGPADRVQKLLDHMKKGPPVGQVEDMKITDEPPTLSKSIFETR